MEDNNMSIGSTIKRLRREKDITQEQLAEYLGITSRAVSRWECERAAPDISQISILCNIFGVSADSLLGIDIEQKEKRINELLAEAKKCAAEDKLIQERIEEEWVVVAEAKIEKYNISAPAFVRRWYASTLQKINKNETAWHVRNMKKRIVQFRDAKLARIPLPGGFEKQTIIADYPWTKLILARYNRKITDPDAAGGYAVAPQSNSETKKFKGIAMGIFDQKTKKYAMPGILLPKAAVPKDEKYHWYDLGRCRLPENPLLYLHSSWRLQLIPSDAHKSPEIYDNDVRVYVSLKLQGPSYVPNSKKPDLYAVDRVLIVRGDLNSQRIFFPLPSGIPPQKLEADLSGAALKVKKFVIDPASSTGVSSPCGTLASGKTFDTAFCDNTGSIKKVSKKHRLEQDGKYHLLKVYSGPLTRDCVLLSGKIKIDLSPCFAMNRAEENYDLLLSVKYTSDRNVYIDRCLIVKK